MKESKDFICLNVHHSVIIDEFIADLCTLMGESTLDTEDYNQFCGVLDESIDFSNSASQKHYWINIFPETMYWVTKGYLASVRLKNGVNRDEVAISASILIEKLLGKIELMMITHPGTESENEIYLN